MRTNQRHTITLVGCACEYFAGLLTRGFSNCLVSTARVCPCSTLQVCCLHWVSYTSEIWHRWFATYTYDGWLSPPDSNINVDVCTCRSIKAVHARNLNHPYITKERPVDWVGKYSVWILIICFQILGRKALQQLDIMWRRRQPPVLWACAGSRSIILSVGIYVVEMTLLRSGRPQDAAKAIPSSWKNLFGDMIIHDWPEVRFLICTDFLDGHWKAPPPKPSPNSWCVLAANYLKKNMQLNILFTDVVNRSYCARCYTRVKSMRAAQRPICGNQSDETSKNRANRRWTFWKLLYTSYFSIPIAWLGQERTLWIIHCLLFTKSFICMLPHRSRNYKKQPKVS